MWLNCAESLFPKATSSPTLRTKKAQRKGSHDAARPNICVSFAPSAEVGTIFALSWLITWFGHVLSDFRHVVRLYDFFLACHPLMPIYFAAVVGTGHEPAPGSTITQPCSFIGPRESLMIIERGDSSQSPGSPS